MANQTEPIDRDELLGEAIEAYLELAEGGQPPDAEDFAAGYPDLGDDLIAALEGLALVKGLVGGGPGGPGHRLEEGRRVAGYRIVRELGRGGMGIVYEAVHVGLDRPVALKVLGTSAAPDSTGRRRFLNEAKTAAGLHHTHIVPVFDVGQVGGLCYYAMQRIEGSGLDRVLRHLRRDRAIAAGSTTGGSASHRSGRGKAAKLEPASLIKPGDVTRTWGGTAPPGSLGGLLGRPEPVDEPPPFVPPRGSSYYRWVADVGRQAAEALGHAHHQGVIHRDIKPSNLLVDAKGMIWVADFGLARRLADPSQTQVDSLLGTPRYMSPEQARTSDIDGRADVYSLGATLYELVTLRPPFDGQTAAELIEQITNKEPGRPRRFDPRVPLDLETILLKALAKRTVDRYASADDLADDLGRFLAHEPVKARRIGPVGRFARFARRHPSITAVTATAATIVLSVATVAHLRVLDAMEEAIHARDDAKKAQTRTEVALKNERVASHQLRLASIDRLEKHATAILLGREADRRSVGLDLLKQAVLLEPDPAMLVKLRDQAVGFLSVRDVHARPPIAASGPHGLAFGADGRRIVALCNDNDLDVWSLDNGQLVEPARPRPVLAQGQPPGPGPGPGPGRGGRGRNPFGPKRIATAGALVAVARPEGMGVRLLDASSPASTPLDLPMKGFDVASIVASPDGRTLVTLDRASRDRHGPGPGGNDDLKVHLWDRNHPDAPKATLAIPPAKLDPSQPGGRPRPFLVAIAPDGSTIAVARLNETEVSLWDRDGKPLDVPTIDVQVNISALAVGPAGLLAASGGGEIVVWDLAQRKPLPGLGRLQGFITQLRFSPTDGSLLAASTGGGGGVELWDLTSYSMVAALQTKEVVEDLAFSPDGKTLAATQPKSIALWSIVEPLAQVQLPESGERPVALAFGPGDRLAIASRDEKLALGALKLWGEPGRCPPEVQTWSQVRPGGVGFNDQGWLMTVDPTALRWFRPDGSKPVDDALIPVRGRPFSKGEAGPAAQPGRNLDRILSARSLDGRTVAIFRQGEVMIWKADDPGAFLRFDPSSGPDLFGGLGRPGNVSALALGPDGARLFALRGDRVVAYSLQGPSGPRPDWTAEVREATAIAPAPDGRTLAVGERSGDLALIDAASGAIRRPTTPPDDATSPISSLAFRPDGLVLAVGTRDQVRLWDLAAEPRPLARLTGQRGAVLALCFNATGERLAAGDEKTVKVWDLARLRDELRRHRLGW